jgi:predicted cobalt transporter CbtA
MVRTLLVRGMLVGIVAGLVSFGFLKLYGEPQLDRALLFETHLEHGEAAGATAGARATDEQRELVSRPVQAGIGLFTGVLVYCVAFGGLFGLAFAFAYGRVGASLTPQAMAALLAAIGFVVVYLVPSLKYPASPPAVGDAETIGLRTALYFIMIALSFVAMVASVSLKRLLVPRLGDWNATVIAAGCYVALAAFAAFMLPAIDEVPDQFPAAVLWQFRVASIGAQFIMWATIGLLFGALTPHHDPRSANGR